MTEPDDKELERDLDRLRPGYSRLPQHGPDDAVDAAIRAAAQRAMPRRRLRTWSAAFATAACIGLAVVLIPAVLIETPAPGNRDTGGELLLRVQRPAAEPPAPAEKAEMAAPDPEVGALAYSPPPMAPAENGAGPSITLREEITRDAAAELSIGQDEQVVAADELPTSAKSVLPESTVMAQAAVPRADMPLESVTVTGSRLTAAMAETDITAEMAAERAALAGADENAWRERLLALRADGREDLALALLADFQTRFERPETLTLDDLAGEQARTRD